MTDEAAPQLPTILDADGRPLHEYAKVLLLGLAPGLVDGLPAEDVAFLEASVGTVCEVDEILDGDVSVMLIETETHYHFIRSPGRLLRIIG